MAIEFNNWGEVTVKSIEAVYPVLYARIIELGTQYRTKMGSVLVISERTSVDDCFAWVETEEGRDFWSLVNIGHFDDASLLHPRFFKQGKKTFVNCFGVEIVEQTQIRADDDVAVDFTKKKRISDY